MTTSFKTKIFKVKSGNSEYWKFDKTVAYLLDLKNCKELEIIVTDKK